MNIRILSKTDIQQCITMFDAINIMRDAFLELAHNNVIQPLRTVIPIKSKDAVTLTMPAYLPKKQQLGIKVVSSFPQNCKIGLESINGVILVIDAQTGMPLALLEAGFLTAIRTGAISGLATDLLCSQEAKHLCIIGSGTQSYTQVEAVAAVRNIEKISVWSRNYQHAIKFAKNLSNRFSIQAIADICDATADADIICTATNSTMPLIHRENIKSNVHINAIGSHSRDMQEIDIDIIKNAQIIVDNLDAACREAGEIITAIEAKQLNPETLIELANIVTQKDVIPRGGISVFKSVGLAIQDISIANFVYQKAVEYNLGSSYDLC